MKRSIEFREVPQGVATGQTVKRAATKRQVTRIGLHRRLRSSGVLQHAEAQIGRNRYETTFERLPAKVRCARSDIQHDASEGEPKVVHGTPSPPTIHSEG